MKSILNDFLLMINFFTRIPVNKNLQCEKENFIRGAFFSSSSCFHYRWNRVFDIFTP